MEFIKILANYILTMSPYLMLGFLVAGIIHVFISSERIKKSFGARGFLGVFKASLLGVPLPLCSCAVIPSAVTLKKNGATNAATSSFLISTPESGVDSILVTYAMMDLPMAIIRPITAFASAFIAGTLQLFFNDKEYEGTTAQVKTSCCGPKSDCSSSKKIERDSFAAKIAKTVKFSFIELVDDLAGWLFVGIVLGACIEYFLPVNLFEGLNPTMGRLVILAIGIPLYICASASTPIAASLMLKGMSPGMALLFLLVGPATNISNILVLSKYIGKKGIIINIASIALVALAASYITDALYSTFNWSIAFNMQDNHLEHSSWYEIALSVGFVILLLRSLLKNNLPHLVKSFFKKDSSSCCG